MARILTCLLLLGLLDGCAPGRSPLAGDAPPALPPAPYCTRSLADVDCWRDPRRLADRPPQVADGGWQAPALGHRHGPEPGPKPGLGRRGGLPRPGQAAAVGTAAGRTGRTPASAVARPPAPAAAPAHPRSAEPVPPGGG